MKENSKAREAVFDAHSHCGSGSSRVMEPLSVCAEKTLRAPGTDSSLWGEMWDLRSVPSGDPSVNICFSLASSGSAVLVSGCLGLSDTPCWLFLPLGPPFLLLSLGTFLGKKKTKLHMRERVIEHLWNRATVRETHGLSVYQDTYTPAAWMSWDLHRLDG